MKTILVFLALNLSGCAGLAYVPDDRACWQSNDGKVSDEIVAKMDHDMDVCQVQSPLPHQFQACMRLKGNHLGMCRFENGEWKARS